jgi:large subunit ribosomal protein L11
MSDAQKLKIVASFKVRNIPGGAATPGGTLGPVLGQKRVDIRKFIKDFNDLTAEHKGKMLRVEVKIMSDTSYKISYGFTPSSQLILQLLNAEREQEAKNTGTAYEKSAGSKTPGLSIIGTIKKSSLEEMAKEKLNEMNTTSLESAVKNLIGTAQSMGILVV